MNSTDAAYIAEVANYLFDDTLTPDAVNDAIATVTAKALHAALEASKALDLVPRPAGFLPGPGWLVGQGVQMFWRVHGKQKIYEVAKSTVKWKWIREYQMAKMGL